MCLSCAWKRNGWENGAHLKYVWCGKYGAGWWYASVVAEEEDVHHLPLLIEKRTSESEFSEFGEFSE